MEPRDPLFARKRPDNASDLRQMLLGIAWEGESQVRFRTRVKTLRPVIGGTERRFRVYE